MGTFFCENMFFVHINFVKQISKWHTSAFPFFWEQFSAIENIWGHFFLLLFIPLCRWCGDVGVGRELGRFIDIYNCPPVLWCSLLNMLWSDFWPVCTFLTFQIFRCYQIIWTVQCASNKFSNSKLFLAKFINQWWYWWPISVQINRDGRQTSRPNLRWYGWSDLHFLLSAISS